MSIDLTNVKEITVKQKPQINIWNEQTELGIISGENGSDVDSTTRLRNIGYIPCEANIEYYCYIANSEAMYVRFYNSEMQFIGKNDNAGNTIITTPNECVYIRFCLAASYGTTYNHDICINLSNPDINGHYYPYAKGVKRITEVVSGEIIWEKS